MTHTFTSVTFGTGLAVVPVVSFFVTGVSITPSGGGTTINLTLTVTSAGGNWSEIWQGAVTSGNYDIVVTHSGSNDACIVGALTAQNVTAAAADTANLAAGTYGTNPHTTSDPLTIPASGLGVCVAQNSAGTPPAATWNNGTEQVDQVVTRAGGGAANMTLALFTTTATPSVDWTLPSYGAMAGAAWGA